MEQVWLEIDRLYEIILSREILFLNFDTFPITTFLQRIKYLNLSVQRFLEISIRNNYLNQPISVKNYINIDLFSCENKLISIRMLNYLEDDDLINYFCTFTTKILPFSYVKHVQGPQFTNNRLGNFISAGVIPRFEFQIMTMSLLENFYVTKKGNQIFVHLYK